MSDNKQNFVPITKDTWFKAQKFIWVSSDKFYDKRVVISNRKLN